MTLINSYSDYLKKRYGAGAYRVSVDAGFSCPHRGRDRSAPGCTFCDGRGSRAPYLEQPADLSALSPGWKRQMKEQVAGGIRFLEKRYGAKVLLLYFQAFTNTFAPAAELKRIYDFVLSLAPFRQFIVSTRPDCIDAEVVRLLATYLDAYDEVWVELGLQSTFDSTLERINRGHGVDAFYTAYERLKSHGIRVAVHLIFGLPGEGRGEIEDTVIRLSALRPDGVKIHNLHIPLDTELHRELLEGEITVIPTQRHLEYLVIALERLPPSTVIMRITSDTPKDHLAAPRYSLSKSHCYEALRERMEGTWQGRLYNPSARDPRSP